MRIVFIGPPGAGKGTQAARLVAYLGVPHLSTGEMLRHAKADGSELGRVAASYMDRGLLVPDDLIMDLVGHRIAEADCAAGYVFDGFPRTVSQARSLDEFLDQRGMHLDCVIELQVADEHILSRLEQRRRETAGTRADDDPRVIPERLARYREQTVPLLRYYGDRGALLTVDGAGSKDEVFARIQRIIDQVGKR